MWNRHPHETHQPDERLDQELETSEWPEVDDGIDDEAFARAIAAGREAADVAA